MSSPSSLLQPIRRLMNNQFSPLILQILMEVRSIPHLRLFQMMRFPNLMTMRAIPFYLPQLVVLLEGPKRVEFIIVNMTKLIAQNVSLSVQDVVGLGTHIGHVMK